MNKRRVTFRWYRGISKRRPNDQSRTVQQPDVLHGLLHCEVRGLDCHVITTEYIYIFIFILL